LVMVFKKKGKRGGKTKGHNSVRRDRNRGGIKNRRRHVGDVNGSSGIYLPLKKKREAPEGTPQSLSKHAPLRNSQAGEKESWTDVSERLRCVSGVG